MSCRCSLPRSNDRVSVILNPSATLRVNYVKNPERPIILRSGQHTGQQRCRVWDSSSLHSQNDNRRGPFVMPVLLTAQQWPRVFCHSERSEESRAFDNPALGSTHTVAVVHCLGFFVAALLRMTAAAGLSSCPCRRASRGGVGAHPRIKYGAGSEHCRRK